MGKALPNTEFLQRDGIYLSRLHLSCRLVPHRWHQTIPTWSFSQEKKGLFMHGKPFQQIGWRPGGAADCLIAVCALVQGSQPTHKQKISLSELSDSSSKPCWCSQTCSQVTAYRSFSAQKQNPHPEPLSWARDVASEIVMDAAMLLAQVLGWEDKLHHRRLVPLPFWALQSGENCIVL